MDVAIAELIGKPALDKEHKKVGKIAHFYLYETDSHPTWVAVTTGFFGTKETLAPLALAEITDDREVVIDADKKTIKDAPSVSPGQELSPSEQERLYQHYKAMVTRRLERGRQTTERVAAGADRGSTTRAEEEQLSAKREADDRERRQLKQYIETEDASMTVPLTEESAWLEREPIADESNAPEMNDDARSGTPVVEQRTVRTERIRLTREDVPSEKTDEHHIRKDQNDLEDK